MLAWFAAVPERRRLDPGEPVQRPLARADRLQRLLDRVALRLRALHGRPRARCGRSGRTSCELVDELYPAHVDASGLLVNWLGAGRLRVHPARRHAGRLLQRAVRPRAAAGRVARGLERRRAARRPLARRARPTAAAAFPAAFWDAARRRVPRHDRRHRRPPARRQRVRDPRRARDAVAGAVGARVHRPHDDAELRQLGRRHERLARRRTGATATTGASIRSSRTSSCWRATRRAPTRRRSS